MTAVADWKKVVEGLLHHTVTSGVLVKVGDGLLAIAGASTEGTNEEKAQRITDLIATELRGRYMASKVQSVQTSHAEEIATAQDDAAAEMT